MTNERERLCERGTHPRWTIVRAHHYWHAEPPGIAPPRWDEANMFDSFEDACAFVAAQLFPAQEVS